jgi:hypothetical protein
MRKKPSRGLFLGGQEIPQKADAVRAARIAQKRQKGGQEAQTAAKGENPLTGRCGRLSSVCVASVERWAFLGEGEIDNDER